MVRASASKMYEPRGGWKAARTRRLQSLRYVSDRSWQHFAKHSLTGSLRRQVHAPEQFRPAWV